jgi:hypothetical protein
VTDSGRLRRTPAEAAAADSRLRSATYTSRLDEVRERPLLLVAAVTCLVLAAAAVAAAGARVVEKGQDLLPYTDAVIWRVRLFDLISIYIEREPYTTKDLFTGCGLVAISALALLAACFLEFGVSDVAKRIRWFFALVWVGTAYLAVDELFAVHESIGHNLRFLRDLPLVDRPDDLIYALYAVPAIAFLILFRDVLLASRWATRLLVTAVVVQIASAGMDVVDLRGEEKLEGIVALLLFAGFLVLSLHHLIVEGRRPAPRGT